MFIYGLMSPTEIDFMPIISTLIPLISGIVIGNLDKELGKFLATCMPFLIVVLGWAVGLGINLLETVRAGLDGILMTAIYYVFTFVPMLFVDKLVVKHGGLSASAIVTLGVVLTAVLTPNLVKHFSANTKNGGQ